MEGGNKDRDVAWNIRMRDPEKDTEHRIQDSGCHPEELSLDACPDEGVKKGPTGAEIHPIQVFPPGLTDGCLGQCLEEIDAAALRLCRAQKGEQQLSRMKCSSCSQHRYKLLPMCLNF